MMHSNSKRKRTAPDAILDANTFHMQSSTYAITWQAYVVISALG